MKSILWGIDLGGTKIEGVALNAQNKTVPLARLRVETGAEKGYEHILSQIQNLIKQLERKTGLHPDIIGFGTPGMLDPNTNTLKNSNTTCLNGKSLKADLERYLGKPIKIANDANCFALAETLIGAARGCFENHEPIVFGVIMGTGVGGGLVVDGRVVEGCHKIAGEWGHNPLHPNGLPCYCGKTGCVETVISGPALEGYYHSLTGHKMSLKEIYKLSRQEAQSEAKATIAHLVKNFSKAIAAVINILDPHIIVLGGGVGNIDELYSETCRREIEKHLFYDRLNTQILKPKLGDSAGVFGAACLTL